MSYSLIVREHVRALVDKWRDEVAEADRVARKHRADGQGEWLTGWVDAHRADADALERLEHLLVPRERDLRRVKKG